MKKSIVVFILLAVIIFSGSLFFRKRTSVPSLLMNKREIQKVTFTTADGVEIVGNFYPQRGNALRRTVLFLHMMPATKESWDSLAKELQKKNVASLAIDLRGHGESMKPQNPKSKIQKLSYETFTDEEHQKSILDVEAALEWLKAKNGEMPISIVGASIGANLALQALADHREIKKAVLLSAGLNYRGIKTTPFVKSLAFNQAVFYATSQDDGNDAKETQELYEATTARNKHIKIYDNAGHGTNMLQNTDLFTLLIDFLIK